MCRPDAPTPAPRTGARLEDGAAVHAADHTGWSRRDFLQRMGLATVGAGFLAAARPVGVFAQAPVLDLLAGAETDRVLVLIHLAGGNDGLNTVVPVDNDRYYHARGGIAIPKAAALGLSADRGPSGLGLHPALAPLLPLWGDGRMGVVHGVGYRALTRSHFDGIDDWMTASGAGPKFTSGWLGRYLLHGRTDEEAARTYRENPPAISLGAAGRLFDTDAGNFGVGRLGFTSTIEEMLGRGAVYSMDGVPESHAAGPMRHLRSQINTSLGYVVRFVEATTKAPNFGTYPPDGLARDLALAARIVRGGLSPRIISVSLGDFDSHANQGGATGNHAKLLERLAGAVRAFYDDLKADGLDQRVVTMTFSEFGRGVVANWAGGTDHGMAAPAFLFGPAVAGGFFGTAPTLDGDVEAGALIPTTDYRALYATLLERWFGVPAADVDGLLGARYDRLGFLGAPDGATTDAPVEASPAADALLAPTPNPFTSTVRLRYRLPSSTAARLSVFDAQGRRVAVVEDRVLPGGEGEATFDGSGLAAGLYVARLETERGAFSRRMVRVR